MKLKVIAMTLVFSGSAFAQKAVVSTASKSVAEPKAMGTKLTTGSNKKAAVEEAAKAQKSNESAQNNLSAAEQRASEDQAKSAQAAYGEKISAVVEKRVEESGCNSGLCKALTTGVSSEGKKGNRKANKVLHEVSEALRAKHADPTVAIENVLKNNDIDPKKVEDACKGK